MASSFGLNDGRDNNQEQPAGGRCYPIQKIIGVHINEENKMYYQVQWEPTWEPSDNLIGCESLVKEFWCRVHPVTLGSNIKQERHDALDRLSSSRENTLLPNVIVENENNVSTSSANEHRPSNHRRSSRIATSSSTSTKKLQNDTSVAARAMKTSLVSKFNPPLPMNKIVFPTGFLRRQRSQKDSCSMSSSLNLSMDESLLPSQSDKASSVSDYQIPACSYTGFTAKSETESMLFEYDSSGKVSGEDDIMMVIERENDKLLVDPTNEPNNNDLTDGQTQSKLIDAKPSPYEINNMLENTEPKYQITNSDNTTRNQIPFACHICLFRSYEKVKLYRHFAKKHSLKKKDVLLTYPCRMCNRDFKGKGYLQTHLTKHTKLDLCPYMCSICALSFSTLCELEVHHLSHEYDLEKDPNEIDGNKPNEKTALLLCQKCSLGFDSQVALDKHLRRHIQTLNPEPVIGKTFDQVGNQLVSGRNLMSSNRRWKRVEKNARGKSLLKRNATKIRAKYRKTKISLPGRGLGDVGSGCNLLFCPYCPSSFTYTKGVGIANLNTHLVLKHQDKNDTVNPVTDLHKCPFCVKMFISERSLSVHVLKKHGGSEEKNSKINMLVKSQANELDGSNESTIKISPRKARQEEQFILEKANAAVERRTRLNKRIRRRQVIMRKRMGPRLNKGIPNTTVSEATSLGAFELQKTKAIRKPGRPPFKYRCTDCRAKFPKQSSLDIHKKYWCKGFKKKMVEMETPVPKVEKEAPKLEEQEKEEPK